MEALVELEARLDVPKNCQDRRYLECLDETSPLGPAEGMQFLIAQ